MAQGRFTRIISMIKWIRTSRLSIKHSFSGFPRWTDAYAPKLMEMPHAPSPKLRVVMRLGMILGAMYADVGIMYAVREGVSALRPAEGGSLRW